MIRKFFRGFATKRDIQQLTDIASLQLEATAQLRMALEYLAQQRMEAQVSPATPNVSVPIPPGMEQPFATFNHPLHFVELFEHAQPETGYVLACNGSILPTLTYLPDVYTPEILQGVRFYPTEGEAINAALPTLAAAQEQDGVLWSTRVRCVMPVSGKNVVGFKETSK